jgi:hypothetical protein
VSIPKIDNQDKQSLLDCDFQVKKTWLLFVCPALLSALPPAPTQPATPIGERGSSPAVAKGGREAP